MDSHELARKLLELPDQHILIATPEESFDIINYIELCNCKSEIIINVE